MAKEYKDLVVGLDIGTAKVMAVVAEVLGNGELKLAGLGVVPNTTQIWREYKLYAFSGFLMAIFAAMNVGRLNVDAAQVTLAKASVVKNTFAKLAEVLVQPNLRSDFRISIPGYGEGRLAFFVVAA